MATSQRKTAEYVGGYAASRSPGPVLWRPAPNLHASCGWLMQAQSCCQSNSQIDRSDRHIEDALKTFAHLRFLLLDEDIQRCHIRYVGRTREQRAEAGRRGFKIEFARQAEPQDLREIVIQAHRGTQHLGVFSWQEPEA